MFLTVKVEVQEGEYHYQGKHTKAVAKLPVTRGFLEQAPRLGGIVAILVQSALEEYDNLPEKEVTEDELGNTD